MNVTATLEAIIFMSDRPITLERINNLLSDKFSPEEITSGINHLKEQFLEENHGIILMEIAGGYQFRSKPELADIIKQLAKTKTLSLTPGMLEVLAIIAYKGPISRIDIDKIRGVDSSYMLRSLIDRKLIKITGKSDDLGRPTIYATTKEFLETFNLNDLTDLPKEQELISLAAGKDIKEIRQMINTQKSFFFDEYEELSDLSKTLKNIKSDTFFTKELRLNKTEDTGFDILNKHLAIKEISEENIKASKSDLIVPLQDPTIFKSLTSSTISISISEPAPKVANDVEVI